MATHWRAARRSQESTGAAGEARRSKEQVKGKEKTFFGVSRHFFFPTPLAPSLLFCPLFSLLLPPKTMDETTLNPVVQEALGISRKVNFRSRLSPRFSLFLFKTPLVVVKPNLGSRLDRVFSPSPFN